MDRRSFLKTSAVSLAAIGAESASMSVFAKSPASSQDDLSVLFLGTGAADWNGKDSRGELDASLPGLLRAAYDGLEVLYKTVKK